MSATKLADLDYLTDACRRAGRRLPTGPLRIDLLDGGRTGAEVLRLSAGDDSFVLKSIPKKSWRGPGMERIDAGEPNLWRHGIVRDLPGPVRWPVIDLCDGPSGEFDWLLMEDVTAGIRSRGAFSAEDSLRLFEALAPMHAAFYGHALLDDAPLPDVAGVTRLFTTPLVSFGPQRPPAADWVPRFLTNFQVMGAFAPLFLEYLGPQLAHSYLELAGDDGWKRRLSALPRTLLHGDLRRANIAFVDGELTLFDWELACAGPPGAELQWHCFLHYWAYPPDGVDADVVCDDLYQRYAADLTDRLGGAIDPDELRAGWDLGWIKVVSQLGYVLIDPVYPDGGTPELRAHVRSTCRRAVERALQLADALA